MESLSIRLSRFLDVLGTTSDEIAATLRCLGYQGTPRNSTADPLSLWLSNYFGVPVTIGKDYTQRQHGNLAYYATINGERLLLPDVVRNFVISFDNEQYSLLIRKDQVKKQDKTYVKAA